MPGKWWWGLEGLWFNRSCDAIDSWTFNVHSFLLASLLSTKCLCSHLIHVLNSKISHGVQQAVGADLVRQVQRECINFLHKGEKCFLRFQYAPLRLYPRALVSF